MRIGERLIADGLVSPETVEQALQAQVVTGGRLGTNLVELRVIALDDLAHALGRQHDMAPALQRHFERCDAQVQRRLPTEVAARWHAIPMGRLSDSQIAVAVTDPLPEEGIDELSRYLGADVVLAIAPQLRILYHLEQIYGVERLNRYRRLPTERGDSDDARRRYVQTLDEGVPSAPNALARIAIRRIALPNSGVYDLPPDTSSIEDGLAAMRGCYGRSSLGHTLIQTIEKVLSPPLTAAMVVTLRDGIASGWNGFVIGGNANMIESIALEVHRLPILAAALETSSLAHGAPVEDGLHGRLWHTLAIEPPGHMIAVAAQLGGRPVAALVALSEAECQPAVHSSLELLAAGLGQNFERLLRAAER